MSKAVVFSFTLWLFHKQGHALSTLTVYLATLKDHLFYGFDLHLDQWATDLKSDCFLQHTAPHPVCPSWSLQKALDLLMTLRYTVNIIPADTLHKTVFPLALATRA